VNLAPFHAFASCGGLEKCVRTLRIAGKVPDNVFDGYEKYHYSLLHRLRSAKYHAQTLRDYLESDAAQQVTPAELVYRVNFHFDGFLHVVGSALDVFAHEMITYFGLPIPKLVYFKTASDTLSAARPGDAMLPLLADPSWRPEFSEYRNTAMHANLIAAEYTVVHKVKGGVTSKRIVFPIPDDPRSATPTFTNNPDIALYCDATLKRAISTFNKAYAQVSSRAKTTGSLPL
jgi:hypothetical protein